MYTDDFVPHPSPPQGSCWFVTKLVPAVLTIFMSSLQEATSSLPVGLVAARALEAVDGAVGRLP